MTTPKWIGFLTGLHLALLQFGYFFVLLIHVTSTYLTYATIVLSWMTGTLLGLVLPRLEPRLAVALGMLAFAGTYALVTSDPLALGNLPFAAAGVAISGLWAGRFFVEMQPRFRGADLLFLHENNGFLLGILLQFLGFTLLGRRFLLAAPLVSALLLLGLLQLTRAAEPVPATSATELGA